MLPSFERAQHFFLAHTIFCLRKNTVIDLGRLVALMFGTLTDIQTLMSCPNIQPSWWRFARRSMVEPGEGLVL